MFPFKRLSESRPVERLLCRRQWGHVRLWVVKQPHPSAIPFGPLSPLCQALYQRQTATHAYIRRAYLTQIATAKTIGNRDGHRRIRTPSAHVIYFTTT